VSWVADSRLPALRQGRDSARLAARRRVTLVQVAKPRIVALFALTVLAASLLAGPVGPALTAAIVASAALTVGGAAALNNYLERGLDARMARTRRRPTATGTLPPRAALAFGLIATAGGVAAVGACGGLLAASCAAAGALYYVVVYTMLIKPRTAFSALPGGLAGVFPALIGWTASGGGFDGRIVYLCALIAVWSAPHFWALSYALQDDYLASGVPTPPAVLGEAAAATMILVAAGAVVALSVLSVVTGLYGLTYLIVALPAGGAFVAIAVALAWRRRRAAAWLLYKVSGPYLAALVAAMVIDKLAGP
jgi:protoheme IX farnesyltransferase